MSDGNTLAIGFIDSLPTEIVTKIVSDGNLTLGDLYSLATLCRRLNSLAIPVYLARCGATDPKNQVRVHLVSGNEDTDPVHPSIDLRTLAGLAMHLDLKFLSLLQCHFADDQAIDARAVSRTKLQHSIRQLTRVINGLHFLDEVHLYLTTDFRIDLDGELEIWHSCLHDLLDIIIFKGCRYLMFYEGVFALDPAQLNTATPLGKMASNFAYFLRRGLHLQQGSAMHGPAWAAARPNDYAMTKDRQKSSGVPSVPADAFVRRFNVHRLSLFAGHLLLPPYFAWLLTILRNRCLRQLILTDFDFKLKIWPEILPRIADAVSNRLTHFILMNTVSGLSVDDIIGFVCRLPQLIYLEIEFFFDSLPWPSKSLPVPTFAFIRQLKAPANFVTYILQSPSSPCPPPKPITSAVPLPRLEHIVIPPRIDEMRFDES